ncbi:hypothetical protein BDU57DRAFT_517549 [Ampelomyces quisqualis]|uniref:Uncharacterized protein n=1 Tax=Ampelomyces quisqualis TaxID=50730 RepID=A0A6A5QNX4_AMPQU|nr:hypothetical protein BDU57DRAFT_517549 [Ampelomyces quisqualis]
MCQISRWNDAGIATKRPSCHPSSPLNARIYRLWRAVVGSTAITLVAQHVREPVAGGVLMLGCCNTAAALYITSV